MSLTHKVLKWPKNGHFHTLGVEMNHLGSFKESNKEIISYILEWKKYALKLLQSTIEQ